MIQLTKGQKPAVLQTHGTAWTAAVLDKLARGEIPTKTENERYNHQDVKNALVAETHGKCAYCESKIRHISYGDIEHIVPKSIAPARRFEWENLTLACDRCNTNKSNHDGDHDKFVDPYAVNPERLFLFLGPLIFPVPGKDAPSITERILKLNRSELVERRTERLQGLLKQLEVIQRTIDPELKQILQDDFVQETTSEAEYSAMAKSAERLIQQHQNA